MGSKTRKAQGTTLYICDSIKEKCSQGFDRSWAYVLARFWGLEGYEHGPRTNTRWMTSPHWLFENLDCSREFLRLVLPLGWQEGKLMLQGHRDMRQETKSTEISTGPLWGKGRLIKEFPNFLVRIMALCGNFIIGLLTPLLISQIWGFGNSLFWKCNTLQVDAMHMLVKTLCTRSCGMVLTMHVRMTRLPICVSDCKGNQT
jgi:hypothetical protein